MSTQAAETGPAPDPHTTAGKLADLERRRHEAVHAGSEQAVAKQHERGKKTARERIGMLLDPGSFTEFDEHARHRAYDFGLEATRPYGDGVVTGYGTVDGRPVCVFSQDFTVFGGSLGEVYGEKIVTLMVEGTSHMFITGPDVIKTVTGEDVSFEDLGGAQAHGVKSGVAHYQAKDEQDCIDFARELLSYLPSNNLEEPPRLAGATRDTSEPDGTDAELDTLIPDSPNQPYDMHEVITHVIDDGDFLEVHAGFAPNMVTGFGRVEGASVGVVANQPMHLAGCLDIDAAEKAARFVRTCDAFSI